VKARKKPEKNNHNVPQGALIARIFFLEENEKALV